MEYRCEDGQGRACSTPAVVRLYAPGEAKPVPGAGMCEKHAQTVVDEYAEKLYETWTTRPI